MTFLENVATLSLVPKILGLIFFSPYLIFLSPLCVLFPTFFLINNIYWLSVPYIYCITLHTPHLLYLWTTVVGFSSSSLPVLNSLTEIPSTVYPSHADIPPSLPEFRMQWMPFSANTHSQHWTFYLLFLGATQPPAPPTAPWHLASSCSIC